MQGASELFPPKIAILAGKSGSDYRKKLLMTKFKE